MGLAVAGRGQPDQGDVRTQGKGPGARQIKHFAWEHTDQLQPVRMPMGGQISQAGAVMPPRKYVSGDDRCHRVWVCG